MARAHRRRGRLSFGIPCSHRPQARHDGLRGPLTHLRLGRRPHTRHHHAEGRRLHAQLDARDSTVYSRRNHRVPLSQGVLSHPKRHRVGRHRRGGALLRGGREQGAWLWAGRRAGRAHGRHHRRGRRPSEGRLPGRCPSHLPDVKPLRLVRARRLAHLLCAL